MSSSLKYVGLIISKSTPIAATTTKTTTLISTTSLSQTLHLSCLKSKVRNSCIVSTILSRNYCILSVPQNKRNCLQPPASSLPLPSLLLPTYQEQQYRFKTTVNKISSLFGRPIKSFEKKTKTLSSFHK